MVGLLLAPALGVALLQVSLPIVLPSHPLLPSAMIDALAWRPERAWPDLWRWWSAAWVHWSALHLWGCVAAALLTWSLGWAIPAAPGAARAWAMAWPLTHLTLGWQAQDLTRYGGLSGVIHAGVAVMIVQLLRFPPTPWHRALGATLGVGIISKLLLEAPWQGALVRSPEWDIAVAPLSHVAGTVWGTISALVCLRPPARPGPPNL